MGGGVRSDKPDGAGKFRNRAYVFHDVECFSDAVRRVTAAPTAVVAVSAVFWGLWWLPLRGLEGLGLTPAQVNLWLYLAGAVALAPVLWSRRGRILDGWTPLLAATLYAVAIVAWNGALQTGEVVRATLLFYLSPVWGTLLGRLLLDERVTSQRLAAIVLGLGGATVLLAAAWPPLPRSLGDWLGLGAGATFAGSAAAVRLGRVDGRALTALAFVLAVPVATAVAVAQPGALRMPAPAALPWLAAASLLWLVPVTWALLWGAARLDPGRLGLLMLLEVVAAATSASLLTDEPFGLREAAGCALILAAGLIEAAGATQGRTTA